MIATLVVYVEAGCRMSESVTRFLIFFFLIAFILVLPSLCVAVFKFDCMFITTPIIIKRLARIFAALRHYNWQSFYQ